MAKRELIFALVLFCTAVFSFNAAAAGSSSANITLIIEPYGAVADFDIPVVQLVSPPDAHETTAGSVQFSFNVSDSSEISNCSLIIDEEAKQVLDAVVRNTTQTFTRTMAEGNYVWQVNCTDLGGNTGNSSSRAIRITAAPAAPAEEISGGGAGGGAAKTAIDISGLIEIEPLNLSVDAVIDIETTERLVVRNKMGSGVNLSAEIVGVEDIIRADGLIEVGAESEKDYILKILPKERGVFAGKIVFREKTGMKMIKEIPIIINVRAPEFLFDLTISVLNPNKEVTRGKDIISNISVIQLGEKKDINVTARYMIKDFYGNAYIDYNESFVVFDKKEYIKRFNTLMLKRGEYVAGVEISYPEGFATASAYFKVTGYFWWVIIILAILAMGYIAVRAIRNRRKKLAESLR